MYMKSMFLYCNFCSSCLLFHVTAVSPLRGGTNCCHMKKYSKLSEPTIYDIVILISIRNIKFYKEFYKKSLTLFPMY